MIVFNRVAQEGEEVNFFRQAGMDSGWKIKNRVPGSPSLYSGIFRQRTGKVLLVFGEKATHFRVKVIKIVQTDESFPNC